MTTPNTTAITRAKVRIGRALGALFIGICLAAVALTVSLTGGSSAATAATFAPVADTYVEGGSATKNFGAETLLEIKDSSDIDNDRHAFLKFDLRAVPDASVSSAILKLYVTKLPNGPNAPYKVFTVANDTWAEAGTTWNNAPAQGTQLAAGNAAATGWISLDLTSYVNSQLAGDKLVSIKLLDDSQ